MVDVHELAQELEFREPLCNFSSLRENVEELAEAGEFDKIRLRLEECSNGDEQERSAEQNAWLYGYLGQAYRAIGREDAALQAFENAFEFEPRDRQVATDLVEMLSERQRFAEGLKVVRMLLLSHKQEMSDEEVALLYSQMGHLQEGLQEYGDARVAFEKALVKTPDDPVALTGLLRVVGEVGEPGDVIEARLRLIRSLEQAQARSTALVALGNDWVSQFNDPGRALDTYEEAVTEWSENITAVERIAEVAVELEDWRRVCRAYFTLSTLVDEPSAKAEYLIRSSDVARRQLWEPEKALAGYRKALAWDPTRLDAFKAVTSILVDARDWEHLEAAYVQVIASNQEDPEADPKLLGVLWQKLAELYSEHLERLEDALFAYGQALEYLPDHQQMRSRFVDLAEHRDEYLDDATRHLRVLIKQDRKNPEWVDRLGRVFLRQKTGDQAYCIFRALRAQGVPLDDQVTRLLDRFDTKVVRPVKGTVNPSLMRRYIFAPAMSPTLNECFSILKAGLYEWAGESRRKYGLRRRDRVKLSDQLALVNFYKSIGASLGYVDLPELWRKEDQVGLMNGALVPEGFIVGDELLRSAQEKKVAFFVAKQLFLFMNPFYLATIRPLSDLQGFFLRAMAMVQEETGLAEQFKKDTAYRVMTKRIRGDARKSLAKSIEELTKDKEEVALGPWVEAIEDTANRVGLIFCDDLQVAKECLQNEVRSISQRSIQERLDALIDYSMSDKYFTARAELGLQVA